MPDDTRTAEVTSAIARTTDNSSKGASANKLTDQHHDWVHQFCGIDPRDFENGSANADADHPNQPADTNAGQPNRSVEPDVGASSELADPKAEQAAPATSDGQPDEPSKEEDYGILDRLRQNEIGKGIAGAAYGTVQALAPGGFLAPSPNPHSRTFEFFRGAGETATGIAEAVAGAGGEVVGGILDATGIGAAVGIPVNVASVAVAVQGAGSVSAGVGAMAHAMSMGNDSGGASPAPTGKPQPPVPDKANEIASHVLDPAQGGKPKPGYKGGGEFDNDGRSGSQLLPATDISGNPIKYKEWDVNPLVKGKNRGGERVVTGSDGSSYYTNDHYKNFTKIR